MILWTIVSAYAALATLTFIIAYGLNSPWWRSAIGRNMMATSSLLFVAFGLLSFGQWIGPVPPFWWIVIFFGFGVVFTHRTLLYVSLRRQRQ